MTDFGRQCPATIGVDTNRQRTSTGRSLPRTGWCSRATGRFAPETGALGRGGLCGARFGRRGLLTRWPWGTQL